MAQTTLNTRILLKFEEYSYWNSSIGQSYVLMKGELGICSFTTEGATEPTLLIKVGNGVTPFYQLPWVSGLAADVFAWAKDSGIHMEKVGSGEIVTNVTWDETLNDNKGGIKVQVKSLSTIEEEVTSEGITASVTDETLKLNSANKVKVIKSIELK